MTKSVQKITLSPSRDIPFNKLVLSQSNVRREKAGVSIEQLAESIAQRTLLQSLNVRAIVDAEGNETGMFEVPAGGRRYRALELLVKQKRMSKTQAVPCVVREGGIAEDDSIADNDEPRRPASARSVSRIPDAARPRHERRGHCRAAFRGARDRQAAPAAGVGLAEAA